MSASRLPATATRVQALGFWKTVFLLLGTSRRRAGARQRRQQEILRQRNQRAAVFHVEGLAVLGLLLLNFAVNGMAAYLLYGAVTAGRTIEGERGGKVIVSDWFLFLVEETDRGESEHRKAPTQNQADRSLSLSLGNNVQIVPGGSRSETPADTVLEEAYSREARSLSSGSSREEIARTEAKLRAAVQTSGARDLVARSGVAEGMNRLAGSHSFPAMLGSLALLWWVVMLVSQGEGLEIDLQRRRHPAWEWIFSHPVKGNAVFAAEVLSPLAANPIYWAAPLFVGAAYWLAYDAETGWLAALLAGVPLAVVLASLGKALEIGCMIRLAPRTRGAVLGLLSWFGFASMMLMFLGATSAERVLLGVGRFLAPLTVLPWPWLGLFLGRQADGSFSFWAGMLVCWAASVLTGVLAVWFCVWGANQGLSGHTGGATATRSRHQEGKESRFGREPLYRKEWLWFLRDRSAIVQTILIPLTIAGMQLFNLRGLVQAAQGSWNALCGAAIIFGTYFLWVLGPKSLASEGPALWLSLTWPRGLESLLKAKAWLWSLISTGLVALVLAYVIYVFPAQAWKVALVGLGWLAFARSMAEKTVTLVSPANEAGEITPVPRGRRWAAALGTLTFAIGVLTQQWNLAVVGIVYSAITAAAMWESFRARLPYLYDPWSEKLPPPPTLLHAMVAISILVEVSAVLTAGVVGLGGRQYLGVAQSFAYTLAALGVSVGVASFLAGRGVRLRDVACWPATAAGATEKRRHWWCGDGSRRGAFFLALLAGVVGGVLLGLVAQGYHWILLQVPELAEKVRAAEEQLRQSRDLKISYAFCAVAIAPFAEEYLFRGLLLRALDREWGGWRAVVGSAAFFAIYHPVLAWLPVGLLGVVSALMYKRTGQLASCILLHLAYNAVVTLL